MTEESEFVSCPFCGKDYVGIYTDFQPEDKRSYGVLCRWCGASTPATAKTEEKARAIWNKRPGKKKEQK